MSQSIAPKIVSILFTLFLVSSLYGEQVEPEENTGAVDRNNEQETEVITRLDELPYGFYRGASSISFAFGATLSPTGSFIKHEKEYDRALRFRVETGQVTQTVAGTPAIYFQSIYRNGLSFILDYEYGISDYFGMGFSIQYGDVPSERQDVFPRLIANQSELIEVFPVDRTLYQGTMAGILFSFHPLPESRIDPYLVFRAGFVGFSGYGHEQLYPDPYRFDYRIPNGLGSGFSVGLGVNVFTTRFTGFKFEGSYTRQMLKSDIFSGRSLNLYHVNFGMIFHTGNIGRL